MTTTTDIAGRMAAAAEALLVTLDDGQKGRICLDFADGTERTNWHYIPRERAGLSLQQMRP